MIKLKLLNDVKFRKRGVTYDESFLIEIRFCNLFSENAPRDATDNSFIILTRLLLLVSVS